MPSSRKGAVEKLDLYAKRDGTVGIRNVPKFRDDREEAEWWERNSARITDFAVEHGLPGKRPARGAARAISLRLPERDLECARKQAESKGLAYQTYIKMLLHEALGREERKLGKVAALRTAIDKGDASGVAGGDSFARVRERLILRQKRR